MERYALHTGVDVAVTASELFVGQLDVAVSARGRFVVNLSGGSTPLDLYIILAKREDLDWRHTWVVWGDERFVPPDHALSNARAARTALLDHVPIPADQILAWPWSQGGTPEEAAAAYAKTLVENLGASSTYDLTLLGLGEDGHTASLFPGTGAVFAPGTTAAVRPAGAETARLTMTPAALSRSQVVAFLVRGEGKREALAATLAGTGQLDLYPARSVAAAERLLWITDLTGLDIPAQR